MVSSGGSTGRVEQGFEGSGDSGAGSCKGFDVDNAVKLLVNAFGAEKYTKKIIKRGLDFPRSHSDHIYEIPEQLTITK